MSEAGVDDLYAGTAAGTRPVVQVSSGSIRTDDGRDRSSRLYVPGTLPDGPVPLLVALHGGAGSASQFAANSGFDDLAEANGFIVVYPDGIGLRPDGTGLRTWNGGYCCGPADTNHPIEGGVGSGISGVTFRPALAAVEAMAAADGCGSTPVTATARSNPDLTLTTWSGCGGGASVRYLVVEGASHAWMGHPPASDAAGGLVGDPYPDLDAGRAVWAFLTVHPRA